MRTIPSMMPLVAAGIDTHGDRWRYRRGLDGGIRRLRARSREARDRRPAEGLRARLARPMCRGRYFRSTRRRRRRWRRKSRPARSNSRCTISAASISRSSNIARTQNISRDAARQAIVESIRASSTGVAQPIPMPTAVVEALARFVETPGQTLTHQADAARQGAGDAADPAVEDRPADRAGAIPDRGFDGWTSLSAHALSGKLSRM